MEKRGQRTIKGMLMVAVMIVILVHTGLHLAIYGTQTSSEKGISGLTIGTISTNDIREKLQERFPAAANMSRTILILEWIAVAGVFAGLFFIRKFYHHKEDVPLDVNVSEISRGKSKTDIDVLYELIKEKKRIKILSITKLFDVKEETALEWAKILESSNLAAINYPRVGDPELVINEKI